MWLLNYYNINHDFHAYYIILIILLLCSIYLSRFVQYIHTMPIYVCKKKKTKFYK